MGRHPNSPNWAALYELASGQAGYFTRQQAENAGYSRASLSYHTKQEQFARARHGIYRLVQHPHSEQEELVIYWLWSEQQGVYSVETALNLHELSDVLPSKLHLTLPESWRTRRLRVPDGLVLHFADILDNDRTWVGPVPVTKPKRTIEDCISAHVQPDLIDQAIADAATHGLITKATALALTKNARVQR
ncbi:MAG: hypothetical protein A2289_24355 [Deltaproteobacteria bacterium RIFOXYA12_FULL_58_15]|nr:MAG: hypothetical protein A2289_24355 [Deltaproteobacteria bacterium RIFOXYA12_FULL_58_15]